MSAPPDPRCFLLRTISDFYGSPGEDPPNRCNPLTDGKVPTTWGVPGGKKPPVRFLIATVPDPMRSHLSLFFDRGIDAIQQGAQSAGYVFSRAGMPWDWEHHDPPSDLSTKLAWEHYQREKEKLSGLMIFRKIPSGAFSKIKDPNHPTDEERESLEETEDLFVWVVGETPTGGIHKHQFDNALEIMRDIARMNGVISAKDQKELSILGPTFSGSLPSLRDLLPDLKNEPIKFGADGPTLRDVVVHSGTVESDAWSNWFRNVPEGVSLFVSFQENDSYAECQFLSYVRSQHFKLRDVAELSEDETAFGGGGSEMTSTAQKVCFPEDTDPDSEREGRDILRLKFPREISQLRAAYQSESQQAPESVAGGKQAPHATLPLEFQDSGSDEDTVPTYAHAQYPLSQESVMLAITTALRAHHSLFILLKASDPIDKLFLVRFLRQDYPEGRIVTLGSDLLYRREVDDDLLHGIMAITPYSLLPRADDQLTLPECRQDEQHIDRIFPSSASVGEYNAMLSLLPVVEKCTNTTTRSQIPPGPYAEFGWPKIASNPPSEADRLRPALWLSALGRDAYWPVAIWPSNLPAMSGKSFPPPPRFPKPPSWLLLNALTVLLCFALGNLLRQGTLLSSSETVAHFAPLLNTWRLRLLAVLCFLALLALALATLPWGWWVGLTRPCWKWPVRILISAGWTLLGAFFGHRLRLRHAGKNLLRTYGGFAIVLLIAAFAIWYRADQQPFPQPSTWNPFFFRYIHATSGVSVLPCALLIVAAGLWWAWHSLQGVSSLDHRRPRLPQAGNDVSWNTVLYSLTEEGNQPLLDALCPSLFSDKRIYLPAVVVAVVVLYLAAEGTAAYLAGGGASVVTKLHHPLQTLEFGFIDVLCFLGYLAIAFVLVVELARLMVCWMELRQSLRALDRLQLRRAFCHLKGFSWNWLWSLEGGSVQDGYRASARELEALQHLLIAESKVSPDPEVKTVTGKIRDLLAQVRPPRPEHKERDFKWTNDLIDEVAKLHCRLRVMCKEELKVLLEGWAREADTSLFCDADPKSAPDNAVPNETRKREQFVALVYVNFVITVLLRIRTIIVTIAGLYILLPLLLSFYPVEPKVVLRALLIILFFIIVGIVGVVYGQMHKDAILSRLTDTTPGELGTDFYLKMGSFVVLPLISLLVSQFPDVNNFLFSWLQPALQALNH